MQGEDELAPPRRTPSDSYLTSCSPVVEMAPRNKTPPRPWRALTSQPFTTPRTGESTTSPLRRVVRPTRGAAVLVGLLYLATLVANKVTFRLVLVDLAPYSHLLAVCTNVIYFLLFVVLCMWQEQQGRITVESWRFVVTGKAGWYLAGAGTAEALTFTMMPFSAARLPGTMLPVMSQMMIPFSMFLGTLALGRRYGALQYIGVFVVLSGVAVCTYPIAFKQGGLRASLGLMLSYFCFTASLVLKEATFRIHHAEQPKGGERLNSFLVSLASTAWQAAVLWVLWPLNFQYVTNLPPAQYVAGAARLILRVRGAGPVLLLVTLYWVAGVSSVLFSAFSASRISPLAVLVLGMVSIPVTAGLFCFPMLSMLPTESVTYSLVIGVVVILLGLGIFNLKAFSASSTR